MACGIYQILNKTNGKCYVGSSIHISSRKTKHFRSLRSNNHHSIKLQRAWNKYGPEAFEWNILQECEDLAGFNKEKLHWLEAFWMAKLRSAEFGYNIEKLTLDYRGKLVSEETKAKMRKPKSEEWKAKMRGQKRTEETKNKMRQAALGHLVSEETRFKLRGQKRTEETKARMSEIAKNRTKEHNQKIGKALRGKLRTLINPMLGKKHSEETKARMRESHFRRKQNVV